MTAGRSERVVHAAARHLPLRLALDLAAMEASVLHRIGRRAPRPDVVATTFGLDERPRDFDYGIRGRGGVRVRSG